MRKYYSLNNILKLDAQYNIIFGERSNGKTYAALKYGIEKYAKNGEKMALIRRWNDDFIGKRGAVMFDALVSNCEISTITGGMWDNVYYYAGRWYLCTYENGERITDTEPFCYGFAISAMEHDKSTAYPDVTTIIFDEFIARTLYLNDEFVLFMNVLSTIIRDRINVKIFMLGNTVNKYCPYFNEMGLKHVKNMESGTIDIYTYGNTDLKVAVEYASSTKGGKKSDIYFAFDNPKLQMITGGAWELNIYPHIPCKFKPDEIMFVFFIIFDGDVLQCECVCHDDLNFIFVHRKTTELKHEDDDLIYTTEYDARSNYRRKINKPVTHTESKIYEYFKKDKVFYADNETGEIMRNYLIWCNKGA